MSHLSLWDQPSQLDRLSVIRPDKAELQKRWQSPESVVVWCNARGELALTAQRDALTQSSTYGDYDEQTQFFLGELAGRPIFVSAPVAEMGGEWGSIRDVGAQLRTEEDLDLAATATAITQWHRLAEHCSSCGAATEVTLGGFGRLCGGCEREHFPRTDPAIIVAVVDGDDRLLLARSPLWPTNRVSVLAGFVESGESFEQAVHREIAEEAGVPLSDLRYAGSQPWPFPRSVMIGFFARAAHPEISIDGDELVYADWFSRERLTEALATGEISMPTSVSIASRLITMWRDATHPYGSA